MDERSTFLAPGQRYARPGLRAWLGDDQLTILQVGRDALGAFWVTYRAADGEDCSGLATEFEEAIAAAEIVPVGADRLTLHC